MGFTASKKQLLSVNSSKKDWKAYCETTFHALKANHHNWGKPDFIRPITRLYYIGVFDCGTPNQTPYISEQALHKWILGNKTVVDHCLSPQFISRMILDNPEKYLCDFETFQNIFWYSCRTIVVTAEENKMLSKLTKHRNNKYQVEVPTNLKYNHLGIKLFARENNQTNWRYAKPADTNILEVPQELLDYEKQFLIE